MHIILTIVHVPWYSDFHALKVLLHLRSMKDKASRRTKKCGIQFHTFIRHYISGGHRMVPFPERESVTSE